MKNLYFVKRSWLYRLETSLDDSVFIATAVVELTPDEANELRQEDDDYDEKFCSYAPDWLGQMWLDCPNMSVYFQGTQVEQLSEREFMVTKCQPQLFNT